jgi:hypothetical protein
VAARVHKLANAKVFFEKMNAIHMLPLQQSLVASVRRSPRQHGFHCC